MEQILSGDIVQVAEIAPGDAHFQTRDLYIGQTFAVDNTCGSTLMPGFNYLEGFHKKFGDLVFSRVRLRKVII